MDDYAHRRPNTKIIAEAIGWPSEGYGRLRLCGPFIARYENGRLTRYFPKPSDVVQFQNCKYQILSPLRSSPFVNNAPADLSLLWIHTYEQTEVTSGWLSEGELHKYLMGMPFKPTQNDDLFVRESRFGIKLDDHKRQVEEGQLYEVEYIRPRKGVGLVEDVDGLEHWPSAGFLAIGGEARAAHYEVIEPSENKVSMIEPGNDGKTCFKLYFATPAYFEEGWKPKGGDWSRFFGKDVRLVAAAFDRPQIIGGAKIDHKSQRSGLFQKPMRRYLPAGSVYFFEADGPLAYTGIPVTETPEGESDLGQIGFGQIFIGRW